MQQWIDPPDTEEALIAWFHTMRAAAPVQRDPVHGGWHVLGYDECRQALTDHASFSSVVASPVPADSPMTLFRVGNLSWLDPPRHSQLRFLVRQVFTPKYVAGLKPVIEKIVDQGMARLRGRESAPFVEDFAEPIAENVIAELLGLPESDRSMFGRWTRALFSITDPSTTENRLPLVIGGARQIKIYIEALIRNRRRKPRDDLTSLLTVTEVDGQKLTDDEIAGLVTLLILTGQTTTQTLSNAVICFDENPSEDAALRSDPALLGGAVDEVMRFRAQTSRVARITTREVELAGQPIGRGQAVSVWLGAADRDPKAFPDPDVFDIRRSPNQHIALGYGAHYCLGAPLARLEVETALRALLDETTAISIDREHSQLLDPRLVFGAGELSVELAW